MAPQISPAIIVGVGPVGEQILERAQEFILQRNGITSLPPIIQFVALNEKTDLTNISSAYAAITNRRSVLKTEELLGIKLTPKRIESYVVSPLDPVFEELTISAGQTLKESSRQTISGGRSGIFLIPKVRPQSVSARSASAERIDAEIKKNLIFNRSFFIDEIDEFGQTLEEPDLIELVARFISLAVASELSGLIRSTPAPYFGDGSHFKAYASFSCGKIQFDRHRLNESFSAYLAEDIRQQLFTKSPSMSGDEAWLAQAEQWFVNSLKRKLQEPKDFQVKDLKLDKDFQMVKNELDDFLWQASRTIFPSVSAYKEALDHLLKRAEIELELHGEKIKQTKKRINELEIKALLGIGNDPQPPAEPLIIQTTTRNWRLIALFGALGFGGLVGLLVFTGGRLQNQTGFTVLAIVCSIVAIFFLRGKRKNVIQEIPPIAAQENALLVAKEEFRRLKKLENIHLALFVYLDLAITNVEHFRSARWDFNAPIESNVFDVDLTSDQLTKVLYQQHYKNKDADLASFKLGLDQFHRVLFSSYNEKLFDHLKNFCRDRFKDSNGFDLSYGMRLHERLKGYPAALAVSSPFWHPRHTDSDKVILAIISEHLEDLRTLLKDTFGEDRVRIVNTQDPSGATFVHIAYGQELGTILDHPASNPTEQENLKVS